MARFWYIPLTLLIMNFYAVVINHANVMSNKPIVSFDYSTVIIFSSLAIAVVLEFVYLFVEKMVME